MTKNRPTLSVLPDTNVFIAAGFDPASSSAAILRAVEDGRIALVWDAQTKAEIEKIISRIPWLYWRRFATLFTPNSEFTGVTSPDLYPQIADRDDRKFAALAAATGATLITNDDGLLSVREKLGIPVMSPREFQARYRF